MKKTLSNARLGKPNESVDLEARTADLWAAARSLDLAQIDPTIAAFPSAGSIAFTGYSADGVDNLAFVALEALASGTVIYFTDNEWNAAGTGFVDANESTFSLTLTSAVAAGTIVTIDNINTAASTTSNFGTVVNVAGGGGNRGFAAGGDTVYAYVANAATPLAPTTFLAAITVQPGGYTNVANGFLTGTGLVVGSTALDLSTVDAGADIGAFNVARNTQTSFAAYAAIINTATNWVTEDTGADDSANSTNPDVPFSSTAFTITGGVETITVQATPVVQPEADSGTTAFVFTLTRSAGTADATVAYAVTGAGGLDASDFVGGALPSGVATFTGSNLTTTVTINVAGDDAVELDETFTLTLSNPSAGYTLGSPSTQTGTITNDDANGSLSIGDVTLAEGNAGTTAFTFTVLRSGGDDGAVGATWTLNAPGGAGLADSGDFDPGQPGTGTVSFLDGETSKTITILVAGDAVFETDETFLVTLSAATGGATLGNSNGTGTITNDDAAPAGTLSIGDVSLAEGNSGGTTFTFTVTRSGGTNGAVMADYAISAPGGAGNASNDDFVIGSIFSGQVSFANGETSKTITIDVLGDAAFEADEAFSVTLSNATGGASIGDGSGAGTILNDDAAPVAGSVSIADAMIVEGNSGTSILILTLTRSGGTAAFDVGFATSNGGNPLNASATAGSDYVAASGTVSFAAGQNTQTIQITINGDVTPELDEEFTVTLSGPTAGATIADGSAVATIETDDPQPATTRIFDEDFTGFTAAGFAPNPTATQIDSDIWRVVGLSDIANPAYGFTATTGDFARGTIGTNDPTTAGVYSPTSNPALVVQPTGAELEAGGFIEARITNSSGSTATGFEIAFDWVFRNSGDRASSLVFSYSTDGTNFVTVPAAAFTTPAALAVGATFTTQNETLSLTGLSVADQGFIYLRWTHASSSGGGNRDEVGIDNLTVDSTGGATGPLVSVGDVSVNEAAGTMTFTITRANVAAGAFTVDYATANGTATAGSDYAATNGTLSFTDNQLSATVTVTINDEAIAELDETLSLNLSNASGATIADGQGVGTIVNDDGAPILVSINDVSIVEGDAGTSILTFTVTRTGGSGSFSVDYGTADNSATAPGDYLAASGTLNFTAGQNTQTISVTINGDLTPEASESFFVNLSNPTNNAVITDAQGLGTIVNDEPTFIHDIQGTAYFSPILAGDGITAFNTASTTTVTVRAVVTAVDNVGNRQGYYLAEEITDQDGNLYTSEGIFVMTRNDAGVGTVVSGVSVGDLIAVSARVMEYQSFTNMPITVLVNPTGLSIISTGNVLPTLILGANHPIPNSIMTLVTPDYTDSVDGIGDTFDASLYGLSYWETVEGMMVTIPDMVVADGFVSTSGGDPFLQAYSTVHADPDQINDRGGYTIAGDPPLSPPDTLETDDATVAGGRHLHDGDVNPDIVELDFTGWAMDAPPGLLNGASMGDLLGDVTGIIDFDFTDRKLFVTGMEPGGFVDGGSPVQETTALGSDNRSLTVATFNVENLDPGDGAARFTALANAIANNLNAPDIICIEEMQDNNGATASGGADASVTWQMLVDALNLATGMNYQWVDQEPTPGAEGGQPGGNIRVGFLYNTDRVQLGDLDANATLAERRQYTDRIGDGVRDAGDLIAFSDNMLGGEINTTDWTTTRKSLLGEFTFNGNTVYVTANHWPAKGGSGDFWQFNQTLSTGNPDNSDWAQRNAVANDVYSMLNLIQSGDAGAGIVAGGDFNDFYFYRPLEVLTGYVLPDGSARSGGARFDNLTLTLDEAERYTYTFDGRSQAIDHVVANGLLSDVATYDVVHLNTGYNPVGSPALSDHDPGLASFDYRNFGEVLKGTAGADTIDGFGGNDVITGGAGDDVIMGGTGTDTAVYAGNIGDYEIVRTFDGNGNLISVTVTDQNPADGDEGTDTLTSVEQLQFADAMLNITGAVLLYDNNDQLVGTFATIQAAVDAALADYTVRIPTGVYVEQVTVDGKSGLTIEAVAGADVTIQAPAVLAVNGSSDYFGDDVRAVIAVTDSTDFTLNNVKIDGAFAGDTTPGSNGDELSGVALLNSSGSIDGVEIFDVGNSTTGGLFGLQHGSGLLIDGTGAASQPAVSVTDTNIHDFQKTGALIIGVVLTFADNVITGIGATPLIGQNGLQLALSSGTVSGNTISAFGYDGPGTYASGIITYEPSGALSITGNTITGTGADGHSAGIDLSDVLGIEIVITGNSFADLDYGIYAYTFTGGVIGLDADPDTSGNSFAGIIVEGVHFDPEESYGAPFTTATLFSQTGSQFADYLAGSTGDDTLSGAGGDDEIEGRGGSDTLSGGQGSDRIGGGDSNDTLNGGTQNDLIDGGTGVDTALFAGPGLGLADSVIGWIVSSVEGNDVLQNVEITIDGSGQRNLLVGSTGFATIQAAFDNALSGDIVRLASGSYSGSFTYDADDLTVIAQPGAVLDAAFSTTSGFGITILAAGGNDDIATGEGDDRIDGGAGTDTMAGGTGDDWYYVNGGDTVIEGAAEGTLDRVFASTSYTLSAGAYIENMSTDFHAGTAAIDLTGNELDNLIYGNAGDNDIDGRAGADAMIGWGGNDWYFVDNAGDYIGGESASDGTGDRVFASSSFTLSAGAHIEIFSTDFHAGTAAINLTGNALGNLIYGNAGGNVLDGKQGNDALVGFGGADTFAFTTALGANNVDLVFDFDADDLIALDDAVFTGLSLGSLSASAFTTGGSATTADHRIVYNQATGELFYDADGNGAGAQMLFATLQGAPVLTASDFAVI